MGTAFLEKLIEVSPYAGLVGVTIFCMNRVYHGFAKNTQVMFDKSVETIKEAYRDSASGTQELIQLFAEKLRNE